ncbi:ATP-binding cassette sub-family G member 2-like [Oopsacas minuta]|uniref:ATP-binding cassette sub-family G member 2-like n=1 Tax=Oopsacas minuta TaxID=111878 RepID=A0AAV7JNC3_9METZ|nr:ATP-binding cassette sub-family G member 2-like [Oopsacas minuta]
MAINDINRKLLSNDFSSIHEHKLVDSVSIDSEEDGIVRLAYHKIDYAVPKIDIFGLIKFKEKQILKNVSGIMYPGLNAIMGPTGSGKTTLLDILAARKDKRYIEGEVLMNDKPRSKQFKCITGYVIQDDCLMGTLSVRENIYFSASLRLRNNMSSKKKRAKVQEAIEKLGLLAVADTKIGTEFARGVSGGERKRTHIAMELVIAPSVLFLDEPTTGLDAFTAVNLMKILKKIGEEGKIIIMAIHQPRYAIFNLFDSITLLSHGRTVYQGTTREAIEYFSSQGYECPARENPADFFLDLIADDEQNYLKNVPVNWPDRYEFSNTLQMRIQTKPKHAIIQLASNAITSTNYASNIFWQTFVVGKRTIRNMIRSPTEFLLQVLISTLFSIVIGLIYFQLKLTPSGLQNRAGAIFLMVTIQVFANQSAIMAFMKEKALFIHENANGYYRVSAYFFANLMIDLFPKRIAPILVGGTIMYFMTGFQREFAKYSIYILTTSVTTIAASGFPLLYGSMVNSFAVASLLTAVTFVTMMIFGGLLVNITTLPTWLQWIQYLSVFRLAIITLSINELKGLTFCYDEFRGLGNGTCHRESISFGNINISTVETGEMYLKEQGIPYENEFDLWAGVAGLFCYACILLILTYVLLRIVKKEK